MIKFFSSKQNKFDNLLDSFLEIRKKNNFNSIVVKKIINDVKKNTIDNLIRIGIFKKEDIEIVNIKFLKYANVIFDKNCTRSRNLIFDYFKKYNVDFVGRFGKWAYLWSDDCFLSGKLTAEKIHKNLN